MRRRLLMAWSARLPGRIISHQGAPYLERYYVGTWGDLRVYLHRFVASDPDGVHNHPWERSWSIRLYGPQLEQRLERGAIILRRPGLVNFIQADTFHRVVIPRHLAREELLGERRAECWTLFIHTPRCRGWGFVRPVGARADGTPRMTYVPHDATPATPFSDWYLRAPLGRDLVGRQP